MTDVKNGERSTKMGQAVVKDLCPKPGRLGADCIAIERLSFPCWRRVAFRMSGCPNTLLSMSCSTP